MLLELHGKGGVKKLSFFFLQLKSIFQIYSLQKQGHTVSFRIVSKRQNQEHIVFIPKRILR